MITRLTHVLRGVLFLSTSIALHSAYAESANNLYAQVKPSVGMVLVYTFEGDLVASGSAVTVAPQTMVTNRHVLLPGHRYQVYMSGKGTYEAYQTICDSTQDLCLLDVKNLDADPVEFGDTNKLSVGDVVYTVGAPNEIGNMIGVANATKQKAYSPLQLTLGNGLITALRPVDDGNIIQTNAAVSHGSSGGGLFDAQGRLIGITTFVMLDAQNLNMVLPVNWVERLGVHGAPHKADTGTTPSVEATPSPTPVAPVTASTQAATTQVQQVSTTATTPNTTIATAPLPISPPPAAQSGWIRYGWVAIPIVVILIYLIRRSKREAELEEYKAQAPLPANPQLQRFLDEAQQELDQNQQDLVLWNQVLADNKGNMQRARQSYVERRAARLLSAEKDRQWMAAARQNQGT